MRGRALRLALLAIVLSATTGCASSQPFRTQPERLRGAIRTVGVLPPAIEMAEEQAGVGASNVAPSLEWSAVADRVVAEAFADEMAANHVAVVPIGKGDPDVKEIVELYGAVEFSILRHAFEKNTGELLPREPFPEQVLNLDYSVGPAAEFMDGRGIDALWVVRGINLLPTTSARVMRGVDVTLAVLAALGGVAVPVFERQKLQLRVALIGRDGRVLYYGVADDRTERPSAEPPAECVSTAGEPPPASTGEPSFPDVDLRDPRAARHYLHAALAEYWSKEAP